MTWMWRAFPFEANEKSCIKTSLSFVDSVWEIFGPLLQGVPSVIVPDPVVKDVRSLVRMLADHRVTRIVLVPSLLRAILDEWPNLQAYLPHKMIWTSSGEPLSREVVERFRKTLPESALVNLYGASEVSADVTYHDCSNQVPGTSICIGRPISNTRIYLLDSQLQPVPIGIPGEIYVAGEGLARGYLNRPALTATSFIPNPFGAEPGSRLYRTGDLARYRSDGTIELLGRMDRQVKVRGYRIELNEIEARLNQHPGVKDSIVVMNDGGLRNADHQKSDITDPELNKRLVGYVVLSEPAALTVTELRNFLKEKLPEYMVPSVFVFMTALPLTANGKIDPRALPALDGARPEVVQGLISPRTEIEELVARTWQDVLKLDRIGVEDNFFDMGGSSILAIQIVSRLRDVFNREIGVRSLFEKPTVAALAAEIGELIRGGCAPRLPPITPAPRNGFLPLSFNQEQLWRLDKAMPGTYFFNMPYVYRIGCQLHVAALKKALQQIVQRHEALRTIFTEVDGNAVQVIKDGTDFKLSVVDLRKYPPANSLARAADLILLEREQSFNLAAGPLVRAKLLRLTDRESYLLLTLHHIVGDHWSMQQLRRELILLYESILQGQPLELPPLRIQFGDFAAWERQLSDSASMTHQLAYWKHQLSEPLSKLRFQKVQRIKRRTGNRRINRQFEISDALFTAIKSLAIRENCSVSMVMLTALTLLLYSYTKQRDIRIGVLVANRRSSDTEAVFGHFVNTVVIRTRVSPGMTSNQLLKDVRAATIEAYAHQEFPFEKLAQVLEAERNIDRASLFQVLCNYHKVQPEPPRPAGITIAPFQVSRVAGVPEASVTPIEMIFDIRETSTKLTVGVNRRSGLLNKSQSLRMKAHLTNILAALVSQARTVESVSIEIASAYQ
jgi:non-ribosomal peptide synthetase component F